MLDAILMALFLPCIGMGAILIVYMCLLWYATTHPTTNIIIVKPVTNTGLSPSDLQKLPVITGKDLSSAPECAVCLEDIGKEQSARVIPGCNHAFHLECADTWLSKQPICPVCRAKLLDDPNLFIANSSHHQNQNPC